MTTGPRARRCHVAMELAGVLLLILAAAVAVASGSEPRVDWAAALMDAAAGQVASSLTIPNEAALALLTFTGTGGIALARRVGVRAS